MVKSADRKVTFIFNAVLASHICFVQTLLVLPKNKGTCLKEIPVNQKRSNVNTQNYLETFHFLNGYNTRHNVFTQTTPFQK